MSKIFIFDFDSTFIQAETLDVLAEVALANRPEKSEYLDLIQQMTQDAMNGQLSFEESLRNRLALLELNRAHIEKTVQLLKQKITPSFLRNMDFFKKYADKIYIFSGSFLEIVWPIVQPFSIKHEQVFANRFMYDFEGNILGFDRRNPLAQDQGKVKLANKLHLGGNDVVMIGDGYNDYEVKASGLADTFIAFTENVTRPCIIDSADAIVDSLEGMFLTCNIPYEQSRSLTKVLLLENIHPDVSHFFNKEGYEVECLESALNEEELAIKLKGVSILGIRSKTQLTGALLNKCKDLEAIGVFCVGTNHISLKDCLNNGLAVFNAPFSNTRSVVELAIGEIILLLRQAALAHNRLIQGVWYKSSHDAYETRGKTLGIIGYGNIGSQLSIVAEALGMNVIFYDIDQKLAHGNAKACNSLEALLSQADVVSVHVDGRKENHHLIGQKEFDMMKDKVVFLNLSRDFVVDYAALKKELSTGKIAGVGIDVFPEEPMVSSGHFKTPLQQFDNVILTPHIGGSTIEAQRNIGEYVSQKLHGFIKEGSSLGSLNFPQLGLPKMNCPQRILHLHTNVPGILAQINKLFAEYGINIEGQFLKTNDKVGYVITDSSQKITAEMLTRLNAIEHTIKVRILNNY
jgi:D-3-phosphoglycerate dehydrogenase